MVTRTPGATAQNRIRRLCATVLVCVLGLLALTEKPALGKAPEPAVHHAPISVVPAHEALLVPAHIEHRDAVRRVLFVYRTGGRGGFREVEFRRADPGPYAALVPAADVKHAFLHYAIEGERTDGERIALFASRKAPHRVQILAPLEDMREARLAQRFGGRRSVFSASTDYVDFGSSLAQSSDPLSVGTTETVRDRYFRVEGAYTYRPLRLVREFSIRIGVVRGNAPTPVHDAVAPGETPENRFAVGLNYGAPTVRFRLNDACHLDGEFLTSITEVGFSVGGGSALHLGDLEGSHLTLGFESIQVFGTRFFSRLNLPVGSRVSLAPVIEVTDMPHAAKFGMRLFGELSWDVGGGFLLAGRAGYQSRLFTMGGPSVGATLGYAF